MCQDEIWLRAQGIDTMFLGPILNMVERPYRLCESLKEKENLLL